jgi:hypothetical protein
MKRSIQFIRAPANRIPTPIIEIFSLQKIKKMGKMAIIMVCKRITNVIFSLKRLPIAPLLIIVFCGNFKKK